MRILYVDGASLEAELEVTRALLGVDSLDFDYGRFIAQFHPDRSYYYDSWPVQKQGEADDTFKARAEKKQKLFSILNRTPGMHVRTGTTRWSKRLGQKQKAVDVLLAVDVVSHALNGVTESAALMVSDLDFYPVFEVLLHTQVKTQLIYRTHSTVDELIEVADLAFRLTLNQMMNGLDGNFTAKYRPIDLLTHGPMTDDERSMSVTSELNGQEFAIWKDEQGDFVGFHGNQRSKSPIRDLVIERWNPSGAYNMAFSDGSTYP
jgi:uncharacterized LabA/DUF88 family protein